MRRPTARAGGWARKEYYVTSRGCWSRPGGRAAGGRGGRPTGSGGPGAGARRWVGGNPAASLPLPAASDYVGVPA